MLSYDDSLSGIGRIMVILIVAAFAAGSVYFGLRAWRLANGKLASR